jgi:hypothetical protein
MSEDILRRVVIIAPALRGSCRGLYAICDLVIGQVVAAHLSVAESAHANVNVRASLPAGCRVAGHLPSSPFGFYACAGVFSMYKCDYNNHIQYSMTVSMSDKTIGRIADGLAANEPTPAAIMRLLSPVKREISSGKMHVYVYEFQTGRGYSYVGDNELARSHISQPPGVVVGARLRREEFVDYLFDLDDFSGVYTRYHREDSKASVSQRDPTGA